MKLVGEAAQSLEGFMSEYKVSSSGASASARARQCRALPEAPPS